MIAVAKRTLRNIPVTLAIAASPFSLVAGEQPPLESSVPDDGQTRDTDEASADSSKLELEFRRDRPFGVIGFASPGQMVPHWEFLRLLTVVELQGEIKLTPGQVAGLKPAIDGLMKKQRHWSRARTMPDLLKSEYALALDVLSPAQKMRVEQAMLQRRGVTMFLHEDVQRLLALKPEQIEKIRDTWNAHVKRSRKGWKGTEGRDSYHNVWKIALATLTVKQQRQFQSLTGPVIVRRAVRDRVAIRPAAKDDPPPDFPEYEAADEELDFRRDRPFGGIGFFGDEYGPNYEFMKLATFRAVLQELDVSTEQQKQLDDVRAEFAVRSREKAKEIRRDDSVLNDLRETVAEILDEEQNERLAQIIVQRKGVHVFFDKKVAGQLKLTQPQLRMIQAGWQDHIAKARKGWNEPGEGRRSAHNVFRIALRTLTAEQREQFWKMTGPIIR